MPAPLAALAAALAPLGALAPSSSASTFGGTIWIAIWKRCFGLQATRFKSNSRLSFRPPQHSGLMLRISLILNHPTESQGMPRLPFQGVAPECLRIWTHAMLTGVHLLSRRTPFFYERHHGTGAVHPVLIARCVHHEELGLARGVLEDVPHQRVAAIRSVGEHPDFFSQTPCGIRYNIPPCPCDLQGVARRTSFKIVLSP